MWNQADAPLKITGNAQLGDALFVMGAVEEGEQLPADLYSLRDRLGVQQQQILQLTQRVVLLEAQTPTAYWQRFLLWLRGLWPWRS